MNEKYFYFTIGPVQGFVAQARRTRDFWAGSFLLSWMAGVAMVAVENQKGEIVFPTPAKSYLDWICGAALEKGNAPQQGSVPNRFMAKVPSNFDADAVVEFVRKAWIALAESVWENDVAQFAQHGNGTRTIWERQIADFWEMSWVVSDTSDNTLLDRRKNWRHHFTKPEPGSKCMVMDGWQEISGWEHSRRDESDKQKNFWQAVQKNGSLDFSKKEKLCAIAFVKRRFAHHFKDFEYYANGMRLKGWELSSSRPSVSYMAAVHWIEKLLNHADTENAQKAVRLLGGISTGRSEWGTKIACLENALKNQAGLQRKDIALDGEVFFPESWQNEEQYSDRTKIAELRGVLRGLDVGTPSPFYAILLMDGDSLGVHMSNQESQPKIAKALDKFTSTAPAIIERNNGVLIYAGGDDVLAILPLEDALKCAHELHETYAESFQGTGIPSTLSGAIEFAHMKSPLGSILRDAHFLLDDVAKDGCGRDAIAVRAWKPGGVAFTWAQPWNVALENDKIVIEELAKDLRGNHEEGAQSAFSSKFLYKIREQFELLNPVSDEESCFTPDEITSLIAAEYLSSGIHEGNTTKIEEAKKIIAPLLRQCRPHVRNKQTGQTQRTKTLKMDGALLLRFLAYKGKDVGR